MCRESEGVTWIVVQSQVAPFCLGDVDGEDQYTKFLLVKATQCEVDRRRNKDNGKIE